MVLTCQRPLDCGSGPGIVVGKLLLFKVGDVVLIVGDIFENVKHSTGRLKFIVIYLEATHF